MMLNGQEPQPYSIHYEIDEETSASIIHQIVEDSTGFVWMATDKGIVRFDGERYIQYDLTHLATSNEFYGMTADARGRIWFYSSERSIVRFDYKNDSFISSEFTPELNKQTGVIRSIAWNKDTLYVVCTDRYLYKVWRDLEGEIKLKDINETVLHISLLQFEDNFKVLQQNFDETNYSFSIGDNVLLSYKYEEKTNFTRFSSAYNQGVNWLMCSSHLMRIDESGELYDVFSIKGRQTPSGLRVDQDSIAWISFFKDGLVRLNLKNGEVSKMFDSHTITSTSQSNRSKGIWVSSLENGFFFVPNFETKLLLEGVPIKYIMEQEGSIILSSINGSTFIYDSKTKLLKNGPNLLIQPNYLFRQNDTIYINADNALSKFYLNRETNTLDFTLDYHVIPKVIVVPTFNPEVPVASFTLSMNDNFGTLNYDGNKYSIPFDFSRIGITSITMNSSQDLLINRHSGVFLYLFEDDTKSYRLVPNNANSIDRPRHSYFSDDRNAVIIAENGIYNINLDRAQEVDTIFNEPEETINFSKIVNGNWWFGSNSGLRKVISKKDSKIEYRIDGSWKARAVNDFVFSHGNLYLASKVGVFILDTSFYEDPNERLFLTDIEVFGRKIKPGSIDLIVPYDSANISFKWTPFEYGSKLKSHYRWRLGGSYPWQLSSASDVELSSLKAGSYFFEVQRELDDGNWSNSISVGFVVMPPFYFNPWFVSLVSLIIVFSIGIVFKWRWDLAQEKILLKESLLETQSQALSAQLNPHFVFNAMNTVSSFIAQEEDKKALKYIAKLSKILRRIFSNAQFSAISLQEEIESVKDYVDIEQLRFGAKLQFHYSNSAHSNLAEIKVPSMLIQPLVENAIKYAVFPFEKGGSIWLRVLEKDDIIIVEIEDDGPGFSQEVVNDRNNSSFSSLMAIRRRLEIMKSLNQESATLSVEDISTGGKITIRFYKKETYSA